MTDTSTSDISVDANTVVITQAIDAIDKALTVMLNREVLSSTEVTDVLLDVRSLLTESRN